MRSVGKEARPILRKCQGVELRRNSLRRERYIVRKCPKPPFTEERTVKAPQARLNSSARWRGLRVGKLQLARRHNSWLTRPAEVKSHCNVYLRPHNKDLYWTSTSGHALGVSANRGYRSKWDVWKMIPAHGQFWSASDNSVCGNN
jgi:hypothetical protein